MATIKVRQNGPYLVEGDDVTLIDWNGNAYQTGKAAVRALPLRRLDEQAVLRRHALEVGFQAAEAAVPGSEDKPAQSGR